MNREQSIEALIALVAARDARDTLERAAGWVVQVRHADGSGDVLTLYGMFSEPAAALAWAQEMENGLNSEGEEGFRCQVLAVMPVN